MYQTISDIKNEIKNNEGCIVATAFGDKICIKKYVKSVFHIQYRGSSLSFNMCDKEDLNKNLFYYRLDVRDLDLNTFNKFKSNEQLQYESLNKLWSEIFLDNPTPNPI